MLSPLVITKFDDSTWYPDLRLAGGAGSGNYGHAGRPGAVGGSSPMVLFHGTSSAALASIKKDGLKPGGGKGGDAWFVASRGKDFNAAHPEFKTQPGLIGDRKASVYLADTADHARMFGAIAQKMHPGSQPVVLEVDIPQSAVEKIHYDEGFRDPESGAFRFKGVIRPEWVRGRVDFEGADDESVNSPYAVKALSEPTRRAYVVFLVNDTLKVAGGPGSGNFGHAGRPGHIGGSTVIPSGILSAIQQADGGFTYNALTKDTPTVGYALSIHKEREKILDAKDANVVALAKYTYANRDLLSKTGNYLGGWHNPEDGKVYLDVSTIVKSAAEAERLGREHKQLAYFDLVKGHLVDISEGTHVAKAATESDGAKRWAAFFARSHPARAPADGARTNSSGDRTSPPDLQSDRQIDALGGAGSGNYGHAGRPHILATRPENAVHVAADSQLASMSVAIRHAFAKARAAVKPSLMHSDSTPEDLYRAMAKVPDALEAALLDVMPDALLNAMTAGGSAALTLLETPLRHAAKAKLIQRFDRSNPNAVAWAHAHAAELAKGISETTRQDIADAIERAVQSGDIRSATADILAAVGDADRAELIARTEIMTAANEGQRQSWDQAVDAGLLSDTARREWIATETACPLCLALNGSTAKLGEPYPGGGGDGPPLHPRCRCTEGIQ